MSGPVDASMLVADDGGAAEIDVGAPAASRMPKSKGKPSQPRVFAIERIMSSRVRKGQPEYLIKWVGYGKGFNSWVPRSNIFDQSFVDDYDRVCEAERQARAKGKARAMELPVDMLTAAATVQAVAAAPAAADSSPPAVGCAASDRPAAAGSEPSPSVPPSVTWGSTSTARSRLYPTASLHAPRITPTGALTQRQQKLLTEEAQQHEAAQRLALAARKRQRLEREVAASTAAGEALHYHPASAKAFATSGAAAAVDASGADAADQLAPRTHNRTNAAAPLPAARRKDAMGAPRPASTSAAPPGRAAPRPPVTYASPPVDSAICAQGWRFPCGAARKLLLSNCPQNVRCASEWCNNRKLDRQTCLSRSAGPDAIGAEVTVRSNGVQSAAILISWDPASGTHDLLYYKTSARAETIATGVCLGDVGITLHVESPTVATQNSPDAPLTQMLAAAAAASATATAQQTLRFRCPCGVSFGHADGFWSHARDMIDVLGADSLDQCALCAAYLHAGCGASLDCGALGFRAGAAAVDGVVRALCADCEEVAAQAVSGIASTAADAARRALARPPPRRGASSAEAQVLDAVARLVETVAAQAQLGDTAGCGPAPSQASPGGMPTAQAIDVDDASAVPSGCLAYMCGVCSGCVTAGGNGQCLWRPDGDYACHAVIVQREHSVVLRSVHDIRRALALPPPDSNGTLPLVCARGIVHLCEPADLSVESAPPTATEREQVVRAPIRARVHFDNGAIVWLHERDLLRLAHAPRADLAYSSPAARQLSRSPPLTLPVSKCMQYTRREVECLLCDSAAAYDRLLVAPVGQHLGTNRLGLFVAAPSRELAAAGVGAVDAPDAAARPAQTRAVVFAKGEVIGVFGGLVCRRAELTLDAAKSDSAVWDISSDLCINAAKHGNVTRYMRKIASKLKANVQVETLEINRELVVCFRATRDLHPREELLCQVLAVGASEGSLAKGFWKHSCAKCVAPCDEARDGVVVDARRVEALVASASRVRSDVDIVAGGWPLYKCGVRMPTSRLSRLREKITSRTDGAARTGGLPASRSGKRKPGPQALPPNGKRRAHDAFRSQLPTPPAEDSAANGISASERVVYAHASARALAIAKCTVALAELEGQPDAFSCAACTCNVHAVGGLEMARASTCMLNPTAASARVLLQCTRVVWLQLTEAQRTTLGSARVLLGLMCAELVALRVPPIARAWAAIGELAAQQLKLVTANAIVAFETFRAPHERDHYLQMTTFSLEALRTAVLYQQAQYLSATLADKRRRLDAPVPIIPLPRAPQATPAAQTAAAAAELRARQGIRGTPALTAGMLSPISIPSARLAKAVVPQPSIASGPPLAAAEGELSRLGGFGSHFNSCAQTLAVSIAISLEMQQSESQHRCIASAAALVSGLADTLAAALHLYGLEASWARLVDACELAIRQHEHARKLVSFMPALMAMRQPVRAPPAQTATTLRADQPALIVPFQSRALVPSAEAAASSTVAAAASSAAAAGSSAAAAAPPSAAVAASSTAAAGSSAAAAAPPSAAVAAPSAAAAGSSVDVAAAPSAAAVGSGAAAAAASAAAAGSSAATAAALSVAVADSSAAAAGASANAAAAPSAAAAGSSAVAATALNARIGALGRLL